MASTRIEDRGAFCRVHQFERFTGLLAPVLGRSLLDATKHRFEAMNRALKERAKQRSSNIHTSEGLSGIP